MIGSGLVKDLVIRKLKEPSTWAGIVTFVASAVGWNAPPETQQAIVTVAVAVVSLCLVLTNEHKSPAPLPPAAVPEPAVPVVVQHAPVQAEPGPDNRPADPRAHGDRFGSGRNV